MKQVFSNRLLGPVVIGIWAGVIFRFADNFSFNDETARASKEDLTIVPVIEFKDSLHLLLNYANPFQDFGERQLADTALVLPAKSFPPQPILPPPSVPEISYFGGVSRNPNTAPTGVISISGQSFLVREGDSLQGLRVKKLTAESVVLASGTQTIWVKQKPLSLYP
ncbi:MAG: hypothetical protein SF052_14280 [Bacteroidia bacterium]|nr:hypothetical protein [Bacteroidia bacterium]